MTDVFEHNVGDHEDPVAGPTWMIGFIGVVLLVVVVLGVASVYFQAEKTVEREVVLAVERGVVTQDLLLQPDQRRPRFEAEVIGQQ